MPSASLAVPETISLLGVRVNPVTTDSFLHDMRTAIQERRSLLVGYVNLHTVYEHAHGPDVVREFCERADLMLLDSFPMCWWGKLMGHPLNRETRTTSLDYWPTLFQEAQAKGWRIFFLGGPAEMTARIKERVAERFAALQFAAHHGFIEPGSRAEEDVADKIRQFAPDIVLVGMGMPRQESWILRHASQLDVPCLVAVGAWAEYIAGDIPMAPRALGPLGLEWAFRLVSTPRRNGRRYLVEPLHLVGRFVGDASHRVRSAIGR